MIHAFHAQNYGCLLDVHATLTPLHAFIGPNDSGKSTLLHGMRTVVQFAGSSFKQDETGKWLPFDPFLPAAHPVGETYPILPSSADIILACDVEPGSFMVRANRNGFPGVEEAINNPRVLSTGKERYEYNRRSWDMQSHWLRNPKFGSETVFAQLTAARLVRFDPDALRKPSGLIPETEPFGFLDDRGHGLAGVYFAIRNRNDDAFSSIVKDVRRHFSTIKHLRVKVVTTSEVVLEAELLNGTRVEAKRFSEGLLYYLAFAALAHLEPVSLLLVEEPENGLHPARIAEVVRLLRTIVEEKKTQVIMATHSPLVVNELKPEEVSVVTRKDDEGTKVVRIQDTPDFAERYKSYALGELWIAYANGLDEAPLLTGTEP